MADENDVLDLAKVLREASNDASTLRRDPCPNCGSKHVTYGVEQANGSVFCTQCERLLPGRASVDKYLAMARAALAHVSGAPVEEAEDKKWREWLWLAHGCISQYGDDGEMQCNSYHWQSGFIDFKRESGDEIRRKVLRYWQSEVELAKQSTDIDDAEMREIQAKIRNMTLAEIHIGPLFNAGWAGAVDHVAGELPKLLAALRSHSRISAGEAEMLRLGNDAPYPFGNCVIHLCDAVDHLRHDHSCDHQHYDGWKIATANARKYVEQARAILSDRLQATPGVDVAQILEVADWAKKRHAELDDEEADYAGELLDIAAKLRNAVGGGS